jgi:zinc transport system substrate-binding protein
MKHIPISWGILRGLLTVFLLLPVSAYAQKPFQVTVSIVPQKYFVEKIGGDLVDVSVMVEPGVDPHVYDPRPQQMTALTRSEIYFAAGVPFENVWLDKFSAANPGIVMVHTEAGIEKLKMDDDHHDGDKQGEDHSIKAAHKHSRDHDSFDPHSWLSPSAVLIQARNILRALASFDPAHADLYESNYRKLVAELVDLDLELMKIFRGAGENRQFMVFHPSWGYFAAAYGLVQVPVEIEGKEPKAADLQRLILHAREKGIKAVFVQPQYSATSARVIADAIGGQIVVADPMAEDWAKNLREVAEKFRAALK